MTYYLLLFRKIKYIHPCRNTVLLPQTADGCLIFVSEDSEECLTLISQNSVCINCQIFSVISDGSLFHWKRIFGVIFSERLEFKSIDTLFVLQGGLVSMLLKLTPSGGSISLQHHVPNNSWTEHAVNPENHKVAFIVILHLWITVHWCSPIFETRNSFKLIKPTGYYHLQVTQRTGRHWLSPCAPLHPPPVSWFVNCLIFQMMVHTAVAD